MTLLSSIIAANLEKKFTYCPPYAQNQKLKRGNMIKKEKAYTLLVIVASDQEIEEISTSLQGGNFTLIKQNSADLPHPFLENPPT